MKAASSVALSLLLSTPAAADCLNLLPPIEVPFDGVTLASNAELRLLNTRIEPMMLTLPDSTSRMLEVENDDLGEVVVLPDDLQPLPVGAYEFRFSDTAGTFSVLEAIDDVAPPAPVVALTRESTFTPPSLWPFEECPRQVGSNDFNVFTVDGTERGDVVILNGVVAAIGHDGTTVFSQPRSDSTESFELRLRDAAGNESETTIANTAGGCGCAAGDSPVALSLVVLGLATRRRRTRRGQVSRSKDDSAPRTRTESEPQENRNSEPERALRTSTAFSASP
jgi:MYXO-CTERM domain-containing protein